MTESQASDDGLRRLVASLKIIELLSGQGRDQCKDDVIKATRHAESTWFFEALEPWTPSDDVLGERDVSNSGDNTGNARWESHENASWKWYPKGLERDIESMYEDEQPGGVFADMGMAGLGGAHKMYTPGDPEASCKYLGKRPGHVYLKTAAEARAHC